MIPVVRPSAQQGSGQIGPVSGSLLDIPEAIARPGAEPAAGRAFVAIDAGATKTHAAALIGEDGWHFAQAGPANPDVIGLEGTVEVVVNVLGEVVRQAIPSGEIEVAGAFAGVASVDTAAERSALSSAMSTVVPGASIVVGNDLLGAWATSLLCGPGVVLISGTGSNCFGVDDTGRTWRAGGWGHLLGDEGSAYWIGLHGLKAAVEDRDRRGARTEVTAAALAHFGAESVEGLAKAFYREQWSKSDVAGFAPRVLEVATDGDGVARGICSRAAQALVLHVRTVASVLAFSPPFDVGLVGGIVERDNLVTDQLVAQLADCRITRRSGPACVGGVLLAMRAAGVRASDPERLFERGATAFERCTRAR